MNTEGKLHLKNITADDFGKMRSQYCSIKNLVDELYAMAEMSMSRNQIKTLVEDIYQLGKLVDAYEIFGGYVNRSFGAIVEKDGVTTDYFIRKYKKTATDDDIKVEHSLIEYAIKKGLDTVATVFRTPDGRSFVDLEEEKEGKRVIRKFAVYEFLDGEDTYDWIHTNLKPCEDHSLGELQAKLHNYTSGFDPGEKAEPPILPFLVELQESMPKCHKGLGIPAWDHFYMLWDESVDEMVMMAQRAHDYLARPEILKGLPEVPCHYDYHPGNVKWRDGQCVGVFDFDWAKLDYRLFDVCYGILYTCSSWEAQTDGVLWLDRVKYYLDGYNSFLKTMGDLTPFTPEEIAAFPYMMIASDIYLLNWCSCYYSDWEELNEYEYFYYLAHTLKLLRFIDTNKEKLVKVIESV